MENKYKFFLIGLMSGFFVPFLEQLARNNLDILSHFGFFLVWGGEAWQFVFLFFIVTQSVFLFFRRLRKRINPEHKFIFIISGVSFGFAIVSILSMTISFFTQT